MAARKKTANGRLEISEVSFLTAWPKFPACAVMPLNAMNNPAPAVMNGFFAVLIRSRPDSIQKSPKNAMKIARNRTGCTAGS
jgi:hypothetical protein